MLIISQVRHHVGVLARKLRFKAKLWISQGQDERHGEKAQGAHHLLSSNTKLSTTQCVAKDKFIFNMFLFVCLDAISLWCRTVGACRVEYYAHYENLALLAFSEGMNGVNWQLRKVLRFNCQLRNRKYFKPHLRTENLLFADKLNLWLKIFFI